jgi:tRNA pseudouridine38-40 synthase
MDFRALQTAAKLFEGEHDFLSFAATDPDLTTRRLQITKESDSVGSGGFHPRIMQKESSRVSAPDGLAEDWPLISQTAIRTIFSSTWEHRHTEAGDLLVYRVRGSGFLHHMVRNLVGTMLDIGRGRIDTGKIPNILAARNRAAAGPTAPSRGLFLHSVEYPSTDSDH